MEEENVVKKFLWLLRYRQIDATIMALQPFYAVDEEDVRAQVKRFIEAARPRINEHYLQPAPDGFVIHHIALRGVVHERTDGTLVEESPYTSN